MFLFKRLFGVIIENVTNSSAKSDQKFNIVSHALGGLEEFSSSFSLLNLIWSYWSLWASLPYFIPKHYHHQSEVGKNPHHIKMTWEMTLSWLLILIFFSWMFMFSWTQKCLIIKYYMTWQILNYKRNLSVQMTTCKWSVTEQKSDLKSSQRDSIHFSLEPWDCALPSVLSKKRERGKRESW